MSKLEDLIEEGCTAIAEDAYETFNTIRNEILKSPNSQKELIDKIIKKLEEFRDEYEDTPSEHWNQLDDGLIHQGWFECADCLLNFINTEIKNTKEVSDE